MRSFSDVEELRNHEEDVDNLIKVAVNLDDDDRKISRFILESCEADELAENDDIIYDFYRETEDRRAKFQISECLVKMVVGIGHISETLMQLTLDMTEPSYHSTEINEVAFNRVMWSSEWRDYLETNVKRDIEIKETDSNKSHIETKYDIVSNDKNIGTVMSYRGKHRSKLKVERLEKLRVISSNSEEGIIRNGLRIWINILKEDILSEIPTSIVKDACHFVREFTEQSFTILSLKILSLSYEIVDDELQRDIISSLCNPSEEIGKSAADTLINLVIRMKGNISKKDGAVNTIRREYGVNEGKSVEITAMRRPMFKTSCIALSYLLTDSRIAQILAKAGMLKM